MSTDDALCGTGVYLDCDFTFYGSKPFYSTHGTGAVFFNCDFDVRTTKEQFLVKEGSQVAIIDSRFQHKNDSLFLGWTSAPFVKLNTLANGLCEVIGTNDDDQTKTIMVVATTASGLESASLYLFRFIFSL